MSYKDVQIQSNLLSVRTYHSFKAKAVHLSQSRKKKEEEEEGEDTKKEKQVELKPFVTNHACQPTEQLQLPCMHASML